MHRRRARRIWGIWEKSVSWVSVPEEEGWLSGPVEAKRICALRAPRVGWVVFLPRKKTVDFQISPRPRGGCRMWFRADGKVVIEKLCLSLPYVEKAFNSKVIKSFVPELRSRQVFFVFRDSYVIYIWVMNILCTFHIRVLWVCYNNNNSKDLKQDGDGDSHCNRCARNTLHMFGKEAVEIRGQAETI